MAASEWWIVNQITRPGGPRGPQQTNYVVVQRASRPANAIAGPFATEAEAEAWQTSANSVGNSPGSVAGSAADSVARATGLAAIGDFFTTLEQRSTWVRVGKVVLGIVFIAVGVAKLTDAMPVATKIAKTVGVAAVL